MDTPTLLTVGHGTLGQAAFIALIRGVGIERIIDVRRYPGSRRHPHFRSEAMAAWLADAGVAYRWEEDLGGRRRAPADTPNTGLRNDGFRGYADHMRAPAFRAALGTVLSEAQHEHVAVLCSESMWWRCHRRLLADAAVLLHGTPVVHVLHDDRRTPHEPTDVARRDGDTLVYPGQASLPGL